MNAIVNKLLLGEVDLHTLVSRINLLGRLINLLFDYPNHQVRNFTTSFLKHAHAPGVLLLAL